MHKLEMIFPAGNDNLNILKKTLVARKEVSSTPRSPGRAILTPLSFRALAIPQARR